MATKNTTKKTEAKAAAKTPAAKKTTSAAAAKKAPAKTATKRAPRKPAVTTIDTICAKTEKVINKTKAGAVKGKIAVDIEVWGFEDGSNAKMYIELNDGKITVSPHTYNEKDFRIAVSFANAVAFLDGKMTLKALLESNDFYAEGNIAAAVKLASVF